MMAFRLAHDLGIWDVPRLMDEMPLSLLGEWTAFLDLQQESSTSSSTPKQAAPLTHWRDIKGAFGTLVRKKPN